MKQQIAAIMRALCMISASLSGFSLLHAQSTIFQVHDRPTPEGQEEAGVLAIPQETQGPKLVMDRDSTPIVIFKAAMGDCEAMALIPSAEALKKGLKLQVVFNNRLPVNHKWKTDTKVLHELPFTGPVRIYYDSAGTTSGHGGTFYLDTNHNYGYRLLADGKPIKREGDYITLIRHGYATTVPYDYSKLTMNEAKTFVKKANLTEEFEKEILQPLNQKIENNEPWSGTYKGFRLIMIPTEGQEREHGIEGSLDEYLTNRSICSGESFSQSDGWSFIQLKK